MRYLSSLLLFLVFCLVSGCQEKVDIAAEKSAIATVLDRYVKSVENEDMEMYGSTVCHDSGMVNFGGFGSPIVGWTALDNVMKDQNAALSDTKITVTDESIMVGPTGHVAYATSLWNLKATMGENPVDLPIRCTWVLEKRAGVWTIVHFHKSMAAG